MSETELFGLYALTENLNKIESYNYFDNKECGFIKLGTDFGTSPKVQKLTGSEYRFLMTLHQIKGTPAQLTELKKTLIDYYRRTGQELPCTVDMNMMLGIQKKSKQESRLFVAPQKMLHEYGFKDAANNNKLFGGLIDKGFIRKVINAKTRRGANACYSSHTVYEFTNDWKK